MKNDLKDEIYDMLINVACSSWASATTDKLIKLINKYVESKVVQARLEVMHNCKLI